MIVILITLSLFLSACSKTEMINIGDSVQEQSEQTEQPQQTETQTEVQTQTSGGVSVTKCDDSDLNDPLSVGRVRIKYADGTTKDYYDYCTDIILTEYICEGLNVKTKIAICENECFNIAVKDESCIGCKVGFCVNS